MPSGVSLRAQSALCSLARAMRRSSGLSAGHAAAAWMPGLPSCRALHALRATAVACSLAHPASSRAVCAVRPSCARRWRRGAAHGAGSLPLPGPGSAPRFRNPPPLWSALHRCGAPPGLQGASGCGAASPRGCQGLAGPCGACGAAGSKPWQVRACCRHVAGVLSREALQVRMSSSWRSAAHLLAHKELVAWAKSGIKSAGTWACAGHPATGDGRKAVIGRRKGPRQPLRRVCKPAFVTSTRETLLAKGPLPCFAKQAPDRALRTAVRTPL